MDPDFYRKRAEKRLIAIAILIVIAGGVYWYLSRSGSLAQIASFENSIGQVAVKNIQERFSAPPPLRATASPGLHSAGTSTINRQPGQPSGNAYTLTRAGVIVDTNVQRAENGGANGGLKPLAENTTLDEIAALRLQDMFAKQYFAHVSPSSASAQTVASSVGYDYLAIGENLALGDFNGDSGVVTAWMNSSGHRANILNTHYTQIGVVVREGIFEGEDTWLAVQIFGRPASDCPEPDAGLKSTIDAAQAQLSQVGAQLQTMRAQIEAMSPQRVNYGKVYNQAVDSYNAEVGQYNTLVAQMKSQVAQYNVEAEAFNKCIEL
jgi:uncharacterized protein YkwD